MLGLGLFSLAHPRRPLVLGLWRRLTHLFMNCTQLECKTLGVKISCKLTCFSNYLHDLYCK
jgi:hypothetical protein